MNLSEDFVKARSVESFTMFVQVACVSYYSSLVSSIALQDVESYLVLTRQLLLSSLEDVDMSKVYYPFRLQSNSVQGVDSGLERTRICSCSTQALQNSDASSISRAGSESVMWISSFPRQSFGRHGPISCCSSCKVCGGKVAGSIIHPLSIPIHAAFF